MKKLGLGLLGLVIAATIYYFTVGSQQITSALQQQLDVQLTKLQTHGFGVSDREKTDKTEHFVISLDEPKKAALYFAQKGVALSEEEAEELKGGKLGVDVAYLRSNVSFDLYPAALPTKLNALGADEKDKQILIQLEKMIEKKAFLVHADINHSGTAFKGYMKDINETLQSEGEDIKLAMQGLHFSGNVKDGEIAELKQTLDAIHLYAADQMDMHLLGLQSTYASTGTTTYDYTTDYSVNMMKINDGAGGTLLTDGFTLHSASSVTDGLASEVLKTKLKSIEILNDQEHMKLETSVLDIKINNLDVSAFEKLQNIDPDNTQEFNALLQQLISKNVHLEVSNLSADKVTLEGKSMEGFSLNAVLDIDKSLDISSLETDPMSALNKIDASLKLSLSKALLDVVSQHPKAMIAVMIFKPETNLDKYIYSLELKNGSLSVNGKAIR